MLRCFAALLFVLLLAAACGGGSGPPLTATPTAPPPPPATIEAPSATPFPRFNVALTKCAQGEGWARPSPESQRAHLQALGVENAQIAAEGGGIAGADVSNGQEPVHWEYTILWAFLDTAAHREYAIVNSGLWPAIVDATRLPCSLGTQRIAILVLDNEVISVHGEDRYTQIFEMVARPKPGHFEFLEFDAPPRDPPIGFGIVDESGNGIASCCM